MKPRGAERVGSGQVGRRGERVEREGRGGTVERERGERRGERSGKGEGGGRGEKVGRAREGNHRYCWLEVDLQE